MRRRGVPLKEVMALRASAMDLTRGYLVTPAWRASRMYSTVV